MSHNESVLYFRSDLVDDFALLQLSKLPFSKTGTRRLCLHESEKSPLHVMLVESKPHLSFPRHLHLDGVEVMFVLHGTLKIKLWDLGVDCDFKEYITNN